VLIGGLCADKFVAKTGKDQICLYPSQPKWLGTVLWMQIVLQKLV
jgi:hypothetical protein